MPTSPSLTKIPRGASPRLKSGARRILMEREILDCAAELFAERGYTATSVQNIADAAGVGRTTLYHYFRSKEDFLTALVEDVTVAASTQLQELIDDRTLGPGQQLRMIAETLVTRQLARAVRFRVLDREENNLPPALRHRHQAAKRDVLEKVAKIVRAGIATGEFQAIDPHIAALSLIGMCNWTAWWFKPNAGKSSREVAATVAVLAVNSLCGARPATTDGSPDALIAGIRRALDGLEASIKSGD